MRILVTGDLIEDSYVFGTATRICPEAPVPVVVPQEWKTSWGGAGLVCSQLVRLGAEVFPHFMSFSRKERFFAGNHLICRIDTDSCKPPIPSPLYPFGTEDLALADAIVVSDYGKGAMTRELASQIVSTLKPVFVDAKHHWSWYTGPNTIAFPNEHEEVGRIFDYNRVIWKRGAQGCEMWKDLEGAIKIPATVSEVVDVTGAGDIFMASFVYAWTLQLPAEDCLRFANEMAGESCRHRGTFVVGLQFAQSVLDRLRASRESEQRSPVNSLDSNWLGTLPQHVRDRVEQNAAETLSSNPDVDFVQVFGGSPTGPCTVPVAQIRRRSPSGPTQLSDAPLLVDPQIPDTSDTKSRSVEQDQNPSDSERQCVSKPGQDQVLRPAKS